MFNFYGFFRYYFGFAHFGCYKMKITDFIFSYFFQDLGRFGLKELFLLDPDALK